MRLNSECPFEYKLVNYNDRGATVCVEHLSSFLYGCNCSLNLKWIRGSPWSDAGNWTGSKQLSHHRALALVSRNYYYLRLIFETCNN